MGIKEFAEEIKEVLESMLGREVRISEVTKNNSVQLHALTVMEPGSNVTPTVYLEHYFNQYEGGATMADVAECIYRAYMRDRLENPIDMSWFRDFEQVRDKLRFKLVNYEANGELLKKVPYTRYLDLAKVYYVVVETEVLGSGTILVYDSHMELWGVTVEQLETIALENTCNRQAVLVCSMEEVLTELVGTIEGFDIPAEHQLFLISNPSKCFGAASMCYIETLKELADRVESDLIILPSSVHEVIAKPTSGEVDELFYCKDKVHEVNRTQVSAEEVLSDSVYYYSRENNTLSIA